MPPSVQLPSSGLSSSNRQTSSLRRQPAPGITNTGIESLLELELSVPAGTIRNRGNLGNNLRHTKSLHSVVDRWRTRSTRLVAQRIGALCPRYISCIMLTCHLYHILHPKNRLHSSKQTKKLIPSIYLPICLLLLLFSFFRPGRLAAPTYMIVISDISRWKE